MRKLVTCIVAVATLMMAGAVHAASDGRVIGQDPQLLDSYRVTLCGNDVQERDLVRIERDGKTVGEAIVCRVNADCSVVMVKGAHAPTLQQGDRVVVIQRAPAMPTTVVANTTETAGYKVVGGHSDRLSFSVAGFQPSSMSNIDFSANSGFSADSTGQFNPVSFTSSASFTPTAFGPTANFGSDLNLQPTSFTPTGFGSDLNF